MASYGRAVDIQNLCQILYMASKNHDEKVCNRVVKLVEKWWRRVTHLTPWWNFALIEVFFFFF